jgi:hypothetical protein
LALERSAHINQHQQSCGDCSRPKQAFRTLQAVKDYRQQVVGNNCGQQGALELSFSIDLSLNSNTDAARMLPSLVIMMTNYRRFASGSLPSRLFFMQYLCLPTLSVPALKAFRVEQAPLVSTQARHGTKSGTEVGENPVEKLPAPIATASKGMKACQKNDTT